MLVQLPRFFGMTAIWHMLAGGTKLPDVTGVALYEDVHRQLVSPRIAIHGIRWWLPTFDRFEWAVFIVPPMGRLRPSLCGIRILQLDCGLDFFNRCFSLTEVAVQLWDEWVVFLGFLLAEKGRQIPGQVVPVFWIELMHSAEELLGDFPV